MPRNSSGVYSLPQAPFTPGTVISSSAVNSDFSDIATALTGSVAANGSTPITGQLKTALSGTPAYTSSADATTGFGFNTSGEADVYAGGSTIVAVTSAGITVNGNEAVTGNLVVTGTVTAASFAFAGTGAIQIPAGTSAQRPASSVVGDIRFNTTYGSYEGFDSIDWQVMSQINQSYSLNATVSGGLLTINFFNKLTGLAPTLADPVAIPFRDVTPTAGDINLVLVTSALSINTNGVGASLGTSNNVPFRFWIVAFNNSGTIVLGLINCSNPTQIFPLNVINLQSSTAISNSATSAGVFYTPNGVTVSGAPMAILGMLEYNAGLPTAGTYGSLPSRIESYRLGMKLPGDTIQISTALVATQTNCGAGFTQTAITASITPSNAVNPVAVRAFVSCTAGAGINGQLQLSRGTSPTLIGNTPLMSGLTAGAGAINLAATLFVFDQPGSISPVAYYVFGKATSFVVNDSGATSSIEVTELMG